MVVGYIVPASNDTWQIYWFLKSNQSWKMDTNGYKFHPQYLCILWMMGTKVLPTKNITQKIHISYIIVWAPNPNEIMVFSFTGPHDTSISCIASMGLLYLPHTNVLYSVLVPYNCCICPIQMYCWCTGPIQSEICNLSEHNGQFIWLYSFQTSSKVSRLWCSCKQAGNSSARPTKSWF